MSLEKSAVVTTRSRTPSDTSSISLKSPRAARFAEATAVNSPIEPSHAGRSPFADPPEMAAQHQPSDVGFGYIGETDGSREAQLQPPDHTEYYGPVSPPLRSPMKSAMKVPGTPGRRLENPLSPTFQEEQVLDKEESKLDKQQAKDLKAKTRVRIAKMFLRGVNFSCSLIVLSMLASTFAIFNATKSLPPRNGLPAWAPATKIWPQIVLLSIASVSLFFSLAVFYGYWKGGHKRAEKVGVYYTVFAVVFFVFSIVMWGIGAGILQGSKQNGGGKDIWGWSCKDNKRRELFQQDVSYALICRLQDWSLICCIIEVVIETITILIYSVVFYRFYSKNKLRKSMDVRDKARSDLYLAQLRSQSAPNTPGFGPLSPSFNQHSQYPASPAFPPSAYYAGPDAEEGRAGYAGHSPVQYASQNTTPVSPKPFNLQPPPIRVQTATPKTTHSETFAASQHAPQAPGEQTYASVPIPGAYASPAFAPAGGMTFGASAPMPGQAYTTEHRIESPPGSPRLPRSHV